MPAMLHLERPRLLPLSATLGLEELKLYHEVLPFTIRNWDLSPKEYDALVTNLAGTRTRRLSMKQHRRLSALMEIQFSISPRPVYYDDASAAVLRHPRTAPGGTRAAIGVMCASLEDLEAVAGYFRSLPHGPWLLPDVLQDFLADWAPQTRWYVELLEEAELTLVSGHSSDEDRALARSLSSTLRDEALRAPDKIRDALLLDALRSDCPGVAAWGACALGTHETGAPSTGDAPG